MPMGNRYAEALKTAMRKPGRRSVTIRELSQATRYSYEHIRKILHGNVPHTGRECSDAISEYLGLNADQMWELAQADKLKHRYGLSTLATLPKDTRVAELWAELTDEDKERVIKIMEAYAEATRALKERPKVKASRKGAA